MSKRKFSGILGGFLALALSLFAENCLGEGNSPLQIVARVDRHEFDRQELTMERLTMRGAALMASLVRSAPEIERKIEMTALNSLVDRYLVMSAADSQKWEVDRDELRRLADAAISGYSGILSPRKLEELGISKAKFKEFVKSRVKYDYYLERVLTKQIEVSEDELRKRFKDSGLRYAQPAKLLVDQLLFSISANDPNSLEALRLRVFAIYDRLKNPRANFEKVKQANLSEVGTSTKSSIWIDRNGLTQLLGPQEASNLMKSGLGSLGGPYKVAQGYVIFKVLKRKEATEASFSTARPIIMRELILNRRAKLLHERIETLKKAAKVELLI